MKIDLTDAQRSTLWNACYVAAQRFVDDALEMKKLADAPATSPTQANGYERLVKQFYMQANDTRELLEKFEP